MKIEEVLNFFRNVSEKGTNQFGNPQYMASCPCPRHRYGDRHPSLGISENDCGRIMLNCLAGGIEADILAAVNLTEKDLWTRPTAKEAFGQEVPKWQKDLQAIYDYQDEAGEYAYSKLRYPDPNRGKKMFYGYIGKDGSCDFKHVRKDRYLYNLQELRKAIEQNTPVYYVEGEKDVETLRGLGLTATTAGGTNDWRKKYKDHFASAWVTILADNDTPGQELAQQVAKDIKGTCYCYRIVTPSDREKGDVTDYLEEGHTKDELLQLIEKTPWITKEKRERPLKFEWANNVKIKPVEWLWHPYIVSENVNLLGGEGGTGKSTTIQAIIAAISSGNQPEGMPGELRKTGNCLYLGGEDGNSAVAEKLISLGADMNKIALVENSFSCESEQLIRLLDEVNPVFLTFDALISYMPENMDPNSAANVRHIMDYLRDISRERGLATLAVVHPPKNRGYRLEDRFGGSKAFVDSVRNAIYIGYHPREADARVGMQVKTNLGEAEPFKIKMDPGLGLMWDGTAEGVTKRDIEEAQRMKFYGGGQLEEFVKAVENVLKIHPQGFDMTAAEILEEYRKIINHSISSKSFGQGLNRLAVISALSMKGIVLERGGMIHGTQRYRVFYQLMGGLQSDTLNNTPT